MQRHYERSRNEKGNGKHCPVRSSGLRGALQRGNIPARHFELPLVSIIRRQLGISA